MDAPRSLHGRCGLGRVLEGRADAEVADAARGLVEAVRGDVVAVHVRVGRPVLGFVLLRDEILARDARGVGRRGVGVAAALRVFRPFSSGVGRSCPRTPAAPETRCLMASRAEKYSTSPVTVAPDGEGEPVPGREREPRRQAAVLQHGHPQCAPDDLGVVHERLGALSFGQLAKQLIRTLQRVPQRLDLGGLRAGLHLQ